MRTAKTWFVLLALLLIPIASVEASDRPSLLVAGFSSRVEKTDITMTDIDAPIAGMLSEARTALFDELTDNHPPYEVVDFSKEVTRLRLDETAIMNALGNGTVDPALAPAADYIAYGYLTTLSNVKAQSGALGLSGKDKTVYAELSLRVIDTHTGNVVFVTKADSRRKAELTYHAIVHRNDIGVDDAIRQAIEDAACNLAANVRDAA